MFQHIIIATNNDKMVPMQDNERRYFVQQCKYALCVSPQDPDYLRFCKLVADEVYHNPTALAALYTLLMRRDLSQFVPQLHPFTRAMWHARYRSMSKPKRFVYRVLCSGNMTLRKLALDAETRQQYELVCSATPDRAGIDVAEIGIGVFDRAGMRYPKDLWEQACEQHFPKLKNPGPALWRDVLYHLADQQAWDFQYTRLTNDTRCYTCVLPPLDLLRQRFVQNVGTVDERIWLPEWTIE